MKQKLMAATLAGASLLAAQAVEEKRIEIRMAGPGGGPAGDVLIWNQAGPGMPGPTIEFLSHEMAGPLRVVKGSPYSAEIVSETTQTLADGNRIINRSTSAFFRDSEGRTRREVNIDPPNRPQDAHKLIMIDDPVAGVHYVLNTKDKTARKLALPKSGATRSFTIPDVPPGPNVIVQRMEMRKGSAAANLPTPESLGKQTMEGVEVTGTRTTLRIPAGQIGNEREIVSTTESWFSEELKTTVLSKRIDPRFGDSSTRTTNIRRGDPARYLFEVPADYKLEEGPAAPIRIERKL